MKFKLLVLTLLLALLSNVSLAHAEEFDPSIAPTPTAMPTSTPVKYDLPYPGLLPDHSLYPLKVARDRVMGFLISNPVKKAEFDLMQADKRVEASYMLVSRKKLPLAESSFSKGLNYFDEAIIKARDAKSEGMDIHEVTRRLGLANGKYLEVLKEIEGKLQKDEWKQFEKLKLRVLELGKKVKELKP